MPPAKRGPTLRAQWLGKQLRELREAEKVTITQAGEHILRNGSTISRIESGIVPARVPDVLELLNLYGVSDPTLRDGLAQLSREIWQKGWWDGYAKDVALRTMDHAWIESRATSLRDFSTLVFNGLLQTEQYAEAVIRAAAPDAPETQVKRWVEFRMERQAVLSGATAPPLSTIIDEAILYRMVGGHEVMHQQIAAIVKLASQDNIEVRVLPFAAGAPASPESPFTLFTMPEPYTNVAYVATEAGAIYVEMPEAERFDAAYHRVERAALAPKESRTLLQRRINQMLREEDEHVDPWRSSSAG